ncbi:MAG TPA: methionine--tRNA ligase [Candidatus Pacearchaeota archaeon]|nr:methionine--tRNA ligase [Candidatus Pacearchaeota archaeon]
MKDKFYVTTTIPYANAPPHIGFALEIVQADVLARWKSLKGFDVFFLTGTDEHGTKNYQMAKKAGLKPQKFVDKNSNYFKELTKKLNISNNYFIKTTDKKVHWPGVVKVWNELEKKGDIYKKKYTGKYCSGCERFITEKELEDGKCSNHPNLKIQQISEENYFFKLSKYSSKLKKLIETDKLKIRPLKWKNDFLGLIKDGLTDVSFSRDKNHLPWGIPVPEDENQVMYVWPDALTNYLTGIGFPDKKYKKYWPADVHVVGKDMLRFHTGIWPGMLLSIGLPLPKEVIVHGFLTVGGRKMSKSLGNVVAPLDLVKKYPADSIRYSLMRATPFGDDGDFSEEALKDRHNNELANKLGNLVRRVSVLAEKYGFDEKTREQHLPERFRKALEKDNLEYEEIKRDITLREKKGDLEDVIRLVKIKKEEGLDAHLLSYPQLMSEVTQFFVNKYMETFQFDKALNIIFAYIDCCNEFIQLRRPWEGSKSIDYKKWVLGESVKAIREIAELLWPFIPEASEKIKKQFSAKKIKKSEILFKKK